MLNRFRTSVSGPTLIVQGRPRHTPAVGYIPQVVATVVLLAGLAACGGSDTPTTNGALTPPSNVLDFGEFSSDHVKTDVEYEQIPPVGGPHNPIWQTCGFYPSPILNEYGVHSMEHGAVWITYDPSLSDDEVSVLEALADGDREVLASPYDGLPSQVVASAWGLQLQLESVTDPRLDEFVDFYENGPQTPEPDTPCQDGWNRPATD